MEIIEITNEVLDGRFTIDPQDLQEPDIDDLVASAIQAHLRSDEDEDEDRDADRDGDDENSDLSDVENYNPSILEMTSSDEILEMNKQGIKFREDDEFDEILHQTKTLPLKLTLEQIDAIASNPLVQSILNKMRPEQITPEIISKLLGKR